MMEDRTTIQLTEKLRKELRILASKRDINYQQLLQDMVSVFRELDRDRAIISIPKKLSEKLQDIIKGTDFSTVSEYTTFLIRLILYEKAQNQKIPEKRIRKRLEALGYI